MIDEDAWIRRADEVLAGGLSIHELSAEMQFATSMIAAFYGSESPQMKTFRDATDEIYRSKVAVDHRLQTVTNARTRHDYEYQS